MVAATHAHSDLEVDLGQQVDVFDAIKRAGVILAFEPFPRLSGAYVAEAQTPAGIVVNSGHPIARQRFTAGHELGHHWLGHGTSVDPEMEPLVSWGSGPPTDAEMVAEAFAAWFLMPQRLVRATLAGLGLKEPGKADDVYQLALRLGTSYEATARHLQNLRLADRASVSAWLRVSPATIKRRIASGWPPDDLRNDVFTLDGGSDGQHLVVRPGDRVVVSLQEIPSSGYSWQLVEVPDGCDVIGDGYRDDPVADPEIAGAPVERIIALHVGDTDEHGPVRLTNTLPWASTETGGAFTAHLRITRRRRGFDESYFRRAA